MDRNLCDLYLRMHLIAVTLLGITFSMSSYTHILAI